MHILYGVCERTDCSSRDLVVWAQRWVSAPCVCPVARLLIQFHQTMEQTQGAETQRYARTQFKVHFEPTDPALRVNTLLNGERADL